MRWRIGNKRTMYESEWVTLDLVEVEPPGQQPFEHHVVRMPKPAVAAVVVDPDRGVLLLYRHRFISDMWGWEVPAGTAEPGEDLAAATSREVLEETGWRPGTVKPLFGFYSAHGITDLRFHVFLVEGAEHVGEPVDTYKSEKVEWVSIEEARSIMANGEMPDGPSMLALFHAMESGHLA